MNTIKKIAFGLLLFWGLQQQAQAQLVLTIAGQLDSIGASNGAALLSSFNNPHGISVDGFGNLYVADRFGHRIRKISNSGVVSILAGSGATGSADGQGTAASFNEPWGLCADSLGNVYVADTRNNKIRKIDVNGNVTTLAGTGSFGTSNGAALASTFGNPTGVAIDENTGILYVADHLTHIIRRIDPAGNVSTLAGSPYLTGTANGTGNNARFDRPYGIRLDNNGNIIVADEWNHLIRRVTPTGLVTTIAGTGTTGSTDGQGAVAAFNYPWDVAIDGNDNIFVADGYNNAIRKIDPAGNVSTYAGAAGTAGATDGTGAAARFNGATGIAYFDDTDELFVADAYNQLVRKIINLNIQSVSLQLINGNTTTICEGDTISFRAVPEIYNSYEFLIDGNVVQSSVSEFFSTASLASGTYLLSVRAINNTGGVITSSDIFVQVLAKPTPSIIIVGDTTFFDGDSVQLIASAGSGYLWNTGATTGSIKVFNTGKYWVDVTNSNGCVGRSDTISVNVIQFSPDPVINIIEGAVSVSPDGSTGTVCFGNAALLRSSFNAGNQWFKDGFPIMGATDFEYLATESGAYQVEVTDNLGFILFSNTIDIVALPKQINDFTAVPTNPRPNQTVTFTANLSPQVTSQLWSFGVGNSVANTRSATFAYANTGNYTVRLTTADLIGCTDTLTKLNYITVAENGGGGIGVGDDEIFIPTAFSPNGDGNNDIFYVRGGDITALSLSIYNQWGERLFFSTQQTDGWDGSYNGQQVQIGTYTYIAKITTKDNTEQTFKGHVSVLR